MSMTNCYQPQRVTKITHETKATIVTIMNQTDKINIQIQLQQRKLSWKQGGGGRGKLYQLPHLLKSVGGGTRNK